MICKEFWGSHIEHMPLSQRVVGAWDSRRQNEETSVWHDLTTF